MGKRYIENITINQPFEFVNLVTTDFLQKEGFEYINMKGEMVWKKGNGFVSAPQFIKVDYANGTVTLQAWLKNAILPGVYCGEMGLDGTWGFALKAVLKEKVNSLRSLLIQPVPQAQPVYQQQPVYAGGQPSEPNQQTSFSGQPPVQINPIPVVVHNPTNKATLALVMGLVSIVTWIIPLAGLSTTIIGITSAKTGMKSTARGKAVAGLTLSIIFLVVSIVNWIFSAIENYMSLR